MDERARSDSLSDTTDRPWNVVYVTVLTGVFLVGVVLFSSWSANRMIKEYTPLLDAAMEVRLKATEAHLWFEEIISGDSHEDITYVWQLMDESIWYTRAMLQGGSNEHGEYAAVTDSEIQNELRELLEEQHSIRHMMQRRWELRDSPQGKPGSKLDQQFDEMYRSLAVETQQVEAMLKQSVVQERVFFSRVQLILGGAILVIASLLGYFLFRLISAKDRNSKALRESEALLSSTMSAAPVGVGTIQDRVFRQVNRTFAEMTGYSEEELIGQSSRILYPSESAYLASGRALYSAAGKSIEQAMLRKDGSRMDVMLQVSKTDLGHNVHTFAVVDITERKRDERERLRLAHLLRDIIDSMPSILVGISSNGIITQWNIAAEKEAGVPAGDAVGQPLEKVFPELWSLLGGALELTRTQEPYIVRKASWFMNGQQRFVDVTLFPLVADGVDGAVIRVDDVSDRVHFEETLVQTEKMMSVGGLAAGVAHEINNPLGIILQSSQNTLRRFSKEIPANVEAAGKIGIDLDAMHEYMRERNIFSYLNAIRDAGQRAADIVSSMLKFSRKSESRIAPGNMNTLLDNVIELVRNDYDLARDYDFKKVQIVRQYQESLPDVPCSRTEIEQVMLNLLKNAAQAVSGKPEGSIILRTKVENAFVRVDVQDNGPGMDEMTRKRVFEPFYTTKSPANGTGLGLSVAFFIITQNHGGEMHVTSTPGEGSTFSLLLPISGPRGGWA